MANSGSSSGSVVPARKASSTVRSWSGTEMTSIASPAATVPGSITPVTPMLIGMVLVLAAWAIWAVVAVRRIPSGLRRTLWTVAWSAGPVRAQAVALLVLAVVTVAAIPAARLIGSATLLALPAFLGYRIVSAVTLRSMNDKLARLPRS